MAASGFTPIQLYHSTTNGAAPLAGNLAFGELAVNVYNGKLYYKNSNTGLVSILADASSATGNLPGGSTGSVVYQSATGVTAYLAIGTSTYILTSNGTNPTYTNPASITVGTATLATTANNFANGAANQIIYQTGSGTSSFITAPTTAGYVLSWNGSAFAWASAPAASSAINIAGGLANEIPYQSAPGVTAFNTGFTFNAGTSTFGTTNVTATGVVSGVTLTATGVLTGDTVVGLGASFTSSSNVGVHSFGTLGYSDVNIGVSIAATSTGAIQNIIQNKSSGTAASAGYVVSNDLGTASAYYGDFGMNSSTFSGTGSLQASNSVYLSSVTADLVIGTKTSNYLRFVTNDGAVDAITINPSKAVAFNGDYGVANQILTSAGNANPPVWSTPSAIVIGTATNLAGGVAGAVPYQSAPSTTGFTAAGTAGQYLVSNGTSAPTWQTLAIADNALLWYFMG